MAVITKILCDGCEATSESREVTRDAVAVRVERKTEVKFDLCGRCQQRVINALHGVGG